jgi:hypothetical protein
VRDAPSCLNTRRWLTVAIAVDGLQLLGSGIENGSHWCDLRATFDTEIKSRHSLRENEAFLQLVLLPLASCVNEQYLELVKVHGISATIHKLSGVGSQINIWLLKFHLP